MAGCKGDDNPSAPAQGLPVLATTSVTYTTAISAVSGGNITSEGTSTVTARGVCWSTNSTPTIADKKTTDGTGTGNFVSSITGLVENTRYYVRAYATNSSGTAYGATKSFIARVIYYGYFVPGETPELFASGILNAFNPWAGCTELSPDGIHFFMSVGSANYTSAKLYYSKYLDNERTSFIEPSFTSGFSQSMEPVFSADGLTLTFTGRQSLVSTLDFWTTTYSNNSWSTPVKLPYPINSDANEFRGSYMSDGTFYFGSNRSGALQVYKYSPQSQTAELVSAPINLGNYDCDPCIAKDGHFLIFSSGRAGGLGRLDLYVSFSDGQGGWKTPINLGNKYNSEYDEYGPHLSTDGKFLFFTSHQADKELTYWVDIAAIEKLK
ncbi:MAG: hypothetical protein C0412_01815 [Flavobacterium sp.]|nr:hypothetical protein [Flavobacterium sp.]